MTTVRLREPLKRLAGGRADHVLQGATVVDLRQDGEPGQALRPAESAPRPA